MEIIRQVKFTIIKYVGPPMYRRNVLNVKSGDKELQFVLDKKKFEFLKDKFPVIERYVLSAIFEIKQ